MATFKYMITYSIIPPGVGPDDYEPADLEKRTEVFEIEDPHPEEPREIGGTMVSFGPALGHVYAAIQKTLEPGAAPSVLKMDPVED
ncbi:hypothetical protein ACFT7S_28130 [Streptomyces sp. NPDC057136]|uniref:hypothetical protein n=1 Tax=Streptomyces sp. NPDC057136 TaxID=3346029 RepID=UPI00363B7A52